MLTKSKGRYWPSKEAGVTAGDCYALTNSPNYRIIADLPPFYRQRFRAIEKEIRESFLLR